MPFHTPTFRRTPPSHAEALTSSLLTGLCFVALAGFVAVRYLPQTMGHSHCATEMLVSLDVPRVPESPVSVGSPQIAIDESHFVFVNGPIRDESQHPRTIVVSRRKEVPRQLRKIVEGQLPEKSRFWNSDLQIILPLRAES